MNIILLILAFINVIIWIYMGIMLFGYLKKIPVFRGTTCPDKELIYPSLSVIIPACNEEESLEQTITHLISQDYPDFEVIVINDRSTDRTREILAELEIKYPQLQVITVTDLPPKWLGKNHALDQGVKQSKGEWILFTDADIKYSPNSLKKTVGYALKSELDHLTIGPDVVYKGFFYGGFISFFGLVVAVIFMLSKSAGLGAFNLIKRSTYQAIGGYEAIAMQPVDDFALGKLVAKQGYKQSYGLSKGIISVKLYDNLLAMVKGIEKNQFAGANYSVSATLAMGCFLLFLHVYPFVGLFFGPEWARVLCGVSVLTVFAIYNYSKNYLCLSLRHFFLHPISALLYLWAVLKSMVKILSRGGIEWRGTVYSLEELRKHTL
jgi:glycosyltransferase involved in cell wall biosynthesis